MKTSLILIPVLLAASAAAFAEKPERRWHGPISIEEAEARAAERFSRIDADGDGTLSRDELFSEERRQERTDERRQRKFERLDADGDGAVSAEEYGKRMERLLALDSDEDGQVTREELRAAKHRKTTKRQQGG